MKKAIEILDAERDWLVNQLQSKKEQDPLDILNMTEKLERVQNAITYLSSWPI